MDDFQCPCKSCQLRFESLEKRVDELRTEYRSFNENYHELYTKVELIEQKVNSIDETLKEIKAKQDSESKKESDEYAKIKMAIVTGIITAIIGFIMARILP